MLIYDMLSFFFLFQEKKFRHKPPRFQRHDITTHLIAEVLAIHHFLLSHPLRQSSLLAPGRTRGEFASLLFEKKVENGESNAVYPQGCYS